MESPHKPQKPTWVCVCVCVCVFTSPHSEASLCKMKQASARQRLHLSVSRGLVYHNVPPLALLAPRLELLKTYFTKSREAEEVEGFKEWAFENECQWKAQAPHRGPVVWPLTVKSTYTHKLCAAQQCEKRERKEGRRKRKSRNSKGNPLCPTFDFSWPVFYKLSSPFSSPPPSP